MNDPKYIMLHHSAVSYDKNADQFEANNRYHESLWHFKSSLGFFLGYNYEISKTGQVRQARADGEETAAAYQQGMNDGRCLHICLDGCFDIEKPTPEQIDALKNLLKEKVNQYKIERNNIVFHRDYENKTCPGMNINVKSIRDLAGTKGEELTATPYALMKQDNNPAIYIFGMDGLWHGLGSMGVVKALKGQYNPEEVIKVVDLPSNISFTLSK